MSDESLLKFNLPYRYTWEGGLQGYLIGARNCLVEVQGKDVPGLIFIAIGGHPITRALYRPLQVSDPKEQVVELLASFAPTGSPSRHTFTPLTLEAYKADVAAGMRASYTVNDENGLIHLLQSEIPPYWQESYDADPLFRTPH